MKINEVVLLLEDRIDFLRNKYEYKIDINIFDKLLDNDPTKKKIYLQWMIKNYLSNSNKDRFLKNLCKTKEDLVIFTKLKQQNKIQQKDINQIKYENLYDIIKPYTKNLTSGKEIKKQELANKPLKKETTSLQISKEDDINNRRKQIEYRKKINAAKSRANSVNVLSYSNKFNDFAIGAGTSTLLP